MNQEFKRISELRTSLESYAKLGKGASKNFVKSKGLFNPKQKTNPRLKDIIIKDLEKNFNADFKTDKNQISSISENCCIHLFESLFKDWKLKYHQFETLFNIEPNPLSEEEELAYLFSYLP